MFRLRFANILFANVNIANKASYGYSCLQMHTIVCICKQKETGMKRATLKNTIGFRVSEEQWHRIEEEAENDEVSVHDWCRDAVLEKLERLGNGAEKSRPKETENGRDLVINETLLYAEIAAIRYLLGSGFGLLSAGDLSVEKWNEKVREVDNFPERIARDLMAKKRAKAPTK
jgi:hypothetical protein